MDIKLPDNLKSNLGKTRSRALQVLFATTLFAAIALFGGSILLLYISDRFWATPNAVRLGLQILTLVIFGLFVFRHFSRRNSLANDRNSVIKMVQKYFPKLGDSLQGAVELSSGEHKGMSEALCHAAVNQVGKQAEGMDFTKAVSTERRNKALKYFSIAFVVIVLCSLIDYRALWNTAQRWAMPLANIERYTFISIADMDDTLYVEHGKDFTLPVSIDESSRFEASSIKYQFAGESVKEEILDDYKAVLKLKARTTKTVLHLYAGDSSRDINVIPVLPPAIVKVEYVQSYPEYLNREPETIELKGTQMDILEGSKFQINASTSSDLSMASFIREKLNAQGEVVKTFDVKELKTSGKSFITETMNEGDRLTFKWFDNHGFKNRKDRAITINFTKDNPPFADIPNINKMNYILVDKNFPINILCEDDFGLKSLGIEYSVEKDGERGEWQRKVLRSGQSDSTSLTALFILNAEKLGISEGSTIYIRSTCVDFYPERKWTASAEYSFSIITKEEHAQMIKDKLSEITSKIDDAIVREESNKNKNVVLSQQDEEKINSESTDSAIDSQINNELANAQDLKELAEAAKEAIEMANDNSLFDKQELEKLKKSMDDIQNVAENLMKDAAQTLEDAANSQGTAQNQEGQQSQQSQQAQQGQQGQQGEQSQQQQAQQGQQGQQGEQSQQQQQAQQGQQGQQGQQSQQQQQAQQGQQGQQGQQSQQQQAQQGQQGQQGEQSQQQQAQQGQQGQQGEQQKKEGGDSRQENLEEAVAQQEEILEKLKEANEAAEEANRNSELKIMAQRLKKLAELEKAVATNAGEVFKMVPGIDTEQLKKILKSMLKGIVENQDEIRVELTSLKKEIYKFYDSTKFEEYGKVHTDMEDTNVIGGMDKLIAHLEKNHAFSSNIQAEKWAEKFLEWAKWLEGDKDDQEQQDQEQQEQQQQEQQVDEFLMALLDIIINEQILREDTQEAYKKKDLKNYKELTEKLAEEQGKIGKSLADIVKDAPDANIQKLLLMAGKFMLEAKDYLEKNDAGQDTVNAESAAIEILAKAFEAAAPQSSDQQGMMGMLGAAMGMGQGQGQGPGGQPMGTNAGPTRNVSDNFASTLNKNVKGNPNEKSHNEREADKFVGDSLEEVPQEYRKLMEEYYKRIEKKYE